MRILLPVLLAPRLCQVAGEVFGPNNHDLIDAWNLCVRYFDRKRRLAAFVLDDEVPVYPDAGAIIHRAKVQHDPFM